MIKVLYVGIGGSLGAILRYILGSYIGTLTKHLPFYFSTLTVNIIGCILIGLLTGNYTFLILSVLIVTICFSTSCSISSVPIEILVPAEINITKQIKHVGIINRTIPAKKRKIVNILEGFITGESIFSDRMGAENCVNGLAEKLNTSPRFAAVIIAGEMVRGSGTRTFPPPMNWRKVEDICRRYNVDALISLETFDSNIHFKVKKKYKTKKIKSQNSGEKKKVKVPKYYAHLGIDVNSGWRIYDPSAKLIVDMNTFRDRYSGKIPVRNYGGGPQENAGTSVDYSGGRE